MIRYAPGCYVIHNGEGVADTMELFLDNERIEVLGMTISTIFVKNSLYWDASSYNLTKCFVKFIGSKREMSIGNASNVR